MLKSSKDGKYYYGSCEDLTKRLAEHNNGKMKSTKSRLPCVLHYSEKFESRSEAYRREQFFKTIEGYIWLKTEKII
jgi:putative endonuclease